MRLSVSGLGSKELFNILEQDKSTVEQLIGNSQTPGGNTNRTIHTERRIDL